MHATICRGVRDRSTIISEMVGQIVTRPHSNLKRHRSLEPRETGSNRYCSHSSRRETLINAITDKSNLARTLDTRSVVDTLSHSRRILRSPWRNVFVSILVFLVHYKISERVQADCTTISSGVTYEGTLRVVSKKVIKYDVSITKGKLGFVPYVHLTSLNRQTSQQKQKFKES